MRDGDSALHRQAAEADGRPPQAVRVARAGRPVPERERHGERVDPVGSRHHTACLRGRKRGIGRVGQVVLGDRDAHVVGIAGEPRVLGADDSLEFGELAHELRGLVRLREPGGLARVLVAAELPDEVDEPRRLVGERPAALEERDPVEPPCELIDADRDVAVEGEGRVLEPRVEHLRVARADDIHVPAGCHDCETVLAEREVPLVALHGGDDHALGQAKEALVELGSEDERPFDHVDDLLELPERVVPVAERVERFDDDATALCGIRLDVRRSEGVGVLLCGGDLELAVREAVAEGRARCPPASRRRASRRTSARDARSGGRCRPSASTCRTRAHGRSPASC